MSRGLGKEIARQLRDAGMTVPLCTRDQMDVTDTLSISAFVNDLLEKHGRIDVLVNNAAVLGPVGAVENNNSVEWTDTICANLFGPVQLICAVLPTMKAQGKGKIINIAGGGATGPLPRRSAYATSKAALVRFTETVADEVSGFGIDVNAVLPGPMPTDMLDDILSAGPEALGEREHAAHRKIAGEGAVERAARLVGYLASPESDGLTGRTISARYDPWPFDQAMKSKIVNSDLYTLRRMD